MKKSAVIGNFAKRAVEGAEPFSRQEGGIWRCTCRTRAHVLPCGRTGGSGGELWAHCVLQRVQFSVLKGVCCHCCQIKYNIYNNDGKKIIDIFIIYINVYIFADSSDSRGQLTHTRNTRVWRVNEVLRRRMVPMVLWSRFRKPVV